MDDIFSLYETARALVITLRRENKKLRERNEQLLHIGSQSYRALQLQQESLNPAGIWIADTDEDTMKEVQRSAKTPIGSGGGRVWVWKKVRRFPRHGQDRIPNFMSHPQAQRYRNFKPFEKQFPLEVFERIIRFGGPPLLAATSLASRACFDIFTPTLYRSVKLESFTAFHIFMKKEPPSPFTPLLSRLSINNVRFLEINSAYIWYLPLSTSSLAAYDPLHLDRLTIFVHGDPEEEERDESDDEEEGEDPILKIHPFDLGFLQLCNPTELVLHVNDATSILDPVFRLSTDVALCISGWSRLRSVIFVELDVIWNNQGEVQDGNALVDDSIRFCFLGLGGQVPTASSDISLLWDVSNQTMDVPSINGKSLVDLVVKRDRTLFQPSITSATILVGGQEQVDKLEEIMAGYEDGELPTNLKIGLGNQDYGHNEIDL